jgi:hypothetical protein
MLTTKVLDIVERFDLDMESPTRIMELGDMAPKIPDAQTSLKSDRLFSETVLRSYLHFQGN